MIQLIIGIHGKQAAGKSTLALNLSEAVERIWGFKAERRAFARPVYDIHNLFQAYMSEFGYEPAQKLGPLLQKVGETGRDIYGEDVWVNVMEKYVMDLHESSGEDAVVLIVEDVRYSNELELLRRLGKRLNAATTIVKLEAPEDVRKGRCNSWRDNTTHQSEVDLDYADIGVWDLVARTDENDAMQTLTRVLEHVEEDIAHINPETVRLEAAVLSFNKTLKWLKQERKKGANFRWDYTSDGTKQLSIASIGAIEPLSPSKETEMVNHVQEVMKSYGDEGIQVVQSSKEELSG